MASHKTNKPLKKAAPAGDGASTFTDAERAAMKEHAREMKAQAAGGNDEAAVLEKIAGMKGADRTFAERIHKIMKAHAPMLSPKTWYGMPAYAKDGQVICFFQDAAKFKARYATLGFNDKARLDDGPMWPTSFALKELTPAVETQIVALVKKAVG